jgi:hypothetical protein
MCRINLEEFGFCFIEGAADPIHAHNAARDFAQFFFARLRVLHPLAPRRPEIPDPHRNGKYQLYSLEHQELPVFGELEFRALGFTHQRSVQDRSRRARIAVAALDCPNSIASEPRSPPMQANLRCREGGGIAKVSLSAEDATRLAEDCLPQ